MGKRNFGWHFTGDKLRDGSPLPKLMVWERYKGKLSMCNSGLHVGVTPWNALEYAPGANLRLVEYAEVGETQADKVVCAKRRTIAQMDATQLLRYFARMQAISCIERWSQDPPDEVIAWLFEGDESKRSAAESAAESAAWSAAGSAAWSAAGSAVWSAARSAAGSAVCSAARSAVWSAAGSAAWSAAGSAVCSAARSAVWSAAGSAAWSAVWSEFNSLVYESFEGPMRDVGFTP